MKAARNRWVLYALALGATLLAVRWAGGQDEPVARPSRDVRDERPAPRAEAAAPREALPALDTSLLGARAAAASERDLFPAVSWAQQAREEEVKRNPPPKPAPPPPPQAPPVPFAYMGKLVEDGATTVFLTQGDRPLIARAGETLGGAWRVDRIDEQSMTFTYLPLAKPQTLAFAAAGPNAAASAAPRTPEAPSELADRAAKDD